MKTDVVPRVAVLVGALLSLAAAQIAYCPAPYILIGGEVCLYFPGGTYTWLDARTLCQTAAAPPDPYTGDLAEIQTCELLSSVWNYIYYKLERPSNYWIGGKDEGSEGSWFWVKSGTPVPKGSPFWFTAEPDGSNAENHLVLSPNGYLADGRMDQSYYAICQAYTA
ncbi:C-type lectin domain family 4 member M-like [Procambarus clarkii]|uniref:C-type lectin domain family 4 member M-like n=1 Tax=Procambarus clarkii TaxID=6728 RepID=UPI001E671800|nr:C-type lectin domain family 4 member M-like [Procambarus clarkii]